MIGFLGMQLLAAAYGVAYMIHSAKKRRWSGAAVTGILFALLAGLMTLVLRLSA